MSSGSASRVPGAAPGANSLTAIALAHDVSGRAMSSRTTLPEHKCHGRSVLRFACFVPLTPPSAEWAGPTQRSPSCARVRRRSSLTETAQSTNGT